MIQSKLEKTKYSIVYYFICIFILVTVLVLFFIIKSKNEPIVIGFSSQLTGSHAEIGVQERNGAQLAVEKINSSGGIRGRKISLAINDDYGIPQEAEDGDRDLIQKGVVAIIGHATTAQTFAGLRATNPAKVIMIGATVSTPKLSGVDDYFFRVCPSFEKSSISIAKYIYCKKGFTRMAIVYDSDNYLYSNTYSETFAEKFKEVGGSITDQMAFSSIAKPDFSAIIKILEENNSQGVLIIASDVDTALIAQRIRLENCHIPIFTNAWAQSEALICNGGQAVDGIEVEQSYDLDNKSPEYISFKKQYKARFGKEPSYGAVYSYEATMVLKEALIKTNGRKEGLKKALLETHNYKILMNNFSFDKFGDVDRPWYMSTIRDGKFIMINSFDSTNLAGG